MLWFASPLSRSGSVGWFTIDNRQDSRIRRVAIGRPVWSDDRKAGCLSAACDDCTDEKLHVCQGLEKAVAGIRGLQGTADLSRTASRIRSQHASHLTSRKESDVCGCCDIVSIYILQFDIVDS